MSPAQVSPLPVVLLSVQYDGTDYVGWQVQPNGTAIQAVVEAALSELQGEPVRTVAAGRTDSGVHALAQRVSFAPSRLLPLKAYVAGLNGLLPPDIAVQDAEVRPPGFDARRNARGKIYRYRILRCRQREPLTARYGWQLFPELDIAAMRQAAPHLLGKHDFSAFRAASCQARTTVRTIRRLELTEAGRELLIEVEATAFLKHMVRNLVGTLVEIALGKRDGSALPALLASRDRTLAGRTAPAHGLTLVQVFYPPRDAPQPPQPPPADDPDDADDE